jgi:hypothetical protein
VVGGADAGTNDSGPPPPDASPGDAQIMTPDAGANIEVTVNPGSVTLSGGASQTFTASVTGTTNTGVVFSLVEGPAAGTIDQMGHYVASTVQSQSSFHVEATSVADPTKRGFASVTVTPIVGVAVAPPSVTLSPGEQQRFNAVVTGVADTSVVWSVLEGSAGGMIDQTGLYTAGPNVNASFHVVATSVADPSRSASAVVSTLPLISISLCPTTATLLTGDSLTITASVSGTSDMRLGWSLTPIGNNPDGGTSSCGSVTQAGVYSAPSAASSCTGVLITARSVLDPRRTATANISLTSFEPELTGTINYTGARTGRIYIDFSAGGMPGFSHLGTSIASPGPFAVRGLQINPGAQYTVRAWMDTLGTAQYDVSADPYATLSFGAFGPPGDGGLPDAGGWTGSLTLIDPAVQSPSPPSAQGTAPFDQGVVVIFSGNRDTNGNELADHYNVYASTSPSPGPTNHILVKTLRGGAPNVAVMEPLTNGTAYFFSVSALANGVESATTMVNSTGVLAGAPTGGFSISGTVNLTGIASPGPLYVFAAGSNQSGVGVTRITSPAATQPFTITGIPNGTYQYGAILDRDRSDEIGPTDPATFRGQQGGGLITVNGSNVTGLQIVVPSTDAIAGVTTEHSTFMGRDQYQLTFNILPNLKLPVRASYINAPSDQSKGVLDLGIGNNGNFSWETSISTGVAPQVGASYNFDVTTADGITCNASGSVTAVLATPGNLAPTLNGGLMPVFSWTPPSPAPSTAYSYQIYVSQNVGNGGLRVWSYDRIAGTATSVAYNVDQTAAQAVLMPGGVYNWSLTVVDAYGNRGQASATFTAR